MLPWGAFPSLPVPRNLGDCSSHMQIPETRVRLQRSTERDVRVRGCGLQDAAALARLHTENLSDRFGTQLIEIYYRALMQTGRSFCVCAEANGSMVGYIGVVSSRKQILKVLVSRYLLAVLKCTLRHPRLLVKMLWKCKWPFRFPFLKPHSPDFGCEYRPVVISTNYRNLGIAHLLMAAAEGILMKTGITQAFLSVHPTNTAALRAYEKFGFLSAGREVRPAIPMLKRFGGNTG